MAVTQNLTATEGELDDFLSLLQRVVVVANGKGGVGKTSIATNAAGLAAGAGWRVLFIEMDPQGNAGRDFGYRRDDTYEGDNGAEIFRAIQEGAPLQPVLPSYRNNLDIIPAGEHLADLEDLLIGRARRTTGSVDFALAQSLAPIAPNYDLIVIDTPPTRPYLLRLALTSARWIVIPTRPDAASIDGLESLAAQIIQARASNYAVEVLGAVLFDVGTTATSIRRDAGADITAALGGVAPLFDSVIRHSQASALAARSKGVLIHELAETVDNAPPFWKALRDGVRPARVPGSAPALAEDYTLLVDEMLKRIVAMEESDVEDVQSDNEHSEVEAK